MASTPAKPPDPEPVAPEPVAPEPLPPLENGDFASGDAPQAATAAVRKHAEIARALECT